MSHEPEHFVRNEIETYCKNNTENRSEFMQCATDAAAGVVTGAEASMNYDSESAMEAGDKLSVTNPSHWGEE